MKRKLFLALSLMSAFLLALALNTKATPATCVQADNICYALRGPDGKIFYTKGILVYDHSER